MFQIQRYVLKKEISKCIIFEENNKTDIIHRPFDIFTSNSKSTEKCKY